MKKKANCDNGWRKKWIAVDRKKKKEEKFKLWLIFYRFPVGSLVWVKIYTVRDTRTDRHQIFQEREMFSFFIMFHSGASLTSSTPSFTFGSISPSQLFLHALLISPSFQKTLRPSTWTWLVCTRLSLTTLLVSRVRSRFRTFTLSLPWPTTSPKFLSNDFSDFEKYPPKSVLPFTEKWTTSSEWSIPRTCPPGQSSFGTTLMDNPSNSSILWGNRPSETDGHEWERFVDRVV